MPGYNPGVCNIGRNEIRKRYALALVGFAIAAIVSYAILAFGLPRWVLLISLIPLLMGFEGFFQGYLHFCAGLAAAGVYDFTGSGGTRHKVTDARSHRTDMGKAMHIHAYSIISSAAAMAVAYSVLYLTKPLLANAAMFSELHWIPSAIAAVLTILIVFVKNKRWHKAVGFGMALFALIGLAGYVQEGNFYLSPLNFHTLHSWIGIAALAASLLTVATAAYLKKKKSSKHHMIGYIAAFLSFAALLLGLLMLLGVANLAPAGSASTAGNVTLQVPVSNVLSDVEASTFMGVNLTPMSRQLNNAINGTQYINRSTYRLRVTGLVENSMNLSYDDLLGLPAYSEVAVLPCVEGWKFTAQWTGFRVMDLLNLAKLKPDATYVVFHSSDGYTTGLPIDYLKNQNTLMAYGINNVTLPPDRGFPFQLVAVNKYGYKWAKWITSIEVVNKTVAGYWESRGYSNSANVSG